MRVKKIFIDEGEHLLIVVYIIRFAEELHHMLIVTNIKINLIICCN